MEAFMAFPEEDEAEYRYHDGIQHPQTFLTNEDDGYPAESEPSEDPGEWTMPQYPLSHNYRQEVSQRTPAVNRHVIPGMFPDDESFYGHRHHSRHSSKPRADEDIRPFDEWRDGAFSGTAYVTPQPSRHGFNQPYDQQPRSEPVRPPLRVSRGPSPPGTEPRLQPSPQPLPTETAALRNVEWIALRHTAIPLVQWYVAKRRGNLPSVTATASRIQSTGVQSWYADFLVKMNRRRDDGARQPTNRKSKGRAMTDDEGEED
ncbi:hypothetical protein ACHAPT_013053 [Fusarium lateritium]